MSCPFPGYSLAPDHDGQHSRDCVVCRHPCVAHRRKAGPFQAACPGLYAIEAALAAIRERRASTYPAFEPLRAAVHHGLVAGGTLVG